MTSFHYSVDMGFKSQLKCLLEEICLMFVKSKQQIVRETLLLKLKKKVPWFTDGNRRPRSFAIEELECREVVKVLFVAVDTATIRMSLL